MVRQEKGKTRPRTKTTYPPPVAQLRRLKRTSQLRIPLTHPTTQLSIPVQQYIVQIPENHPSTVLQPEQEPQEPRHQQDQQDEPPLPHTLAPPIAFPPYSSLLISEQCDNESVLAQPSEAVVAWPSTEEAGRFPMQSSFIEDSYLEEDSSDDIWRPRELMFIWRRPAEDETTPAVKQAQRQEQLQAFEVEPEDAEVQGESSEMKEEEKEGDGEEGEGEEEEWEDDLEFFSQAEQARVYTFI